METNIRIFHKIVRSFLYLCDSFCALQALVMSNYISCQPIAPDHIQGALLLPASKSISNRALIMYALAEDKLTASKQPRVNFADCDDSSLMLHALQSPDQLKDAGAAGTVMRFLTAYYAIKEGEWTLTGSERMKQRPIAVLVDALRSLGAEISYPEKQGYPPLLIKGKSLQGGPLSVDGSISSQYITALMLIGPYLQTGLEIKLINKIASLPYIRMTADLMQAFGADVSFEKDLIRILEGKYTPPAAFRIEADWSAASYWFEVLSLAKSGQIILQGLQEDSLQGDARVRAWFRDFGVEAEFVDPAQRVIDKAGMEGQATGKQAYAASPHPNRQYPSGNTLLLRKSAAQCSFFEADFSQQPDLAQTFAVTAALKGIPFRLSGLDSLKIKETDRLQALIQEMLKLGFELEESSPNVLEWQGKRRPPLQEIRIDTYQDHRMAMAFAPAALWVKNQADIKRFEINEPDVVSKSYPAFWEGLKTCGFTLNFL